MRHVVGDIKLYLLNITAFSISLADIDMILKIFLLAVTIGYTVDKWIKLNKKDNDEKDK
jgi:ABC-type uncharacterized transport system YnjBCD permease subunit